MKGKMLLIVAFAKQSGMPGAPGGAGFFSEVWGGFGGEAESEPPYKPLLRSRWPSESHEKLSLTRKARVPDRGRHSSGDP